MCVLLPPLARQSNVVLPHAWCGRMDVGHAVRFACMLYGCMLYAEHDFFDLLPIYLQLGSNASAAYASAVQPSCTTSHTF
mmetsp:Transcript_32765/g.72384  ORF Transcript_32765/g.72384 Transcript_32765/m.72384 type:complete len:80 (+) Transcript_32765:1576-1815(+)